MKILITNDDGIYSPGLLELAEIASAFGEILIVAPDVEQSSMGHAITATRPLSYRKTKVAGFDAFRVNGTPADCVSLGSYHWDKVDVVFSGINLGPNLGNSMWHSGTLAGAKQAALLGMRGIAFSTPSQKQEYNFSHIRPYAEKAIEYLLTMDLNLVNVNFPFSPEGVCWTRQSVRQYDGVVQEAYDPMGRKHFWSTVIPLENSEEGTDRWAISRNLVSMTPLRLDLTDEHQFNRLAGPVDLAVGSGTSS